MGDQQGARDRHLQNIENRYGARGSREAADHDRRVRIVDSIQGTSQRQLQREQNELTRRVGTDRSPHSDRARDLLHYSNVLLRLANRLEGANVGVRRAYGDAEHRGNPRTTQQGEAGVRDVNSVGARATELPRMCPMASRETVDQLRQLSHLTGNRQAAGRVDAVAERLRGDAHRIQGLARAELGERVQRASRSLDEYARDRRGR